MSDIFHRIMYALANRVLPAPSTGDNTNQNIRSTRYGELVTTSLGGSKLHALSDEGSYFVAVNTTPGTGIASVAAESTFDDTKALLYLQNGIANDKRIYLDKLMLSVTAAGTNGTNWNIVMKGDKGASRYTSGGSSITPANVNMADSRTPGLEGTTLKFGALTLAAATSSARVLFQAPMRTVIKVVGDKYTFDFGPSTVAPVAQLATAGTAQLNELIACPPIVLGPGDAFALHEFAASQDTAATYEFALGFWVR